MTDKIRRISRIIARLNAAHKAGKISFAQLARLVACVLAEYGGEGS